MTLVSKLSARRPVIVLAAAAFVAALSVLGAIRYLSLNPDAYALLPEDVPFLQNYNAYKDRFTYDRRTNIAVIDAPSPESAVVAQVELAAALEARNDGVFHTIRAPGTDPFLRRNGLLYLTPDALEQAIDRLAAAEPAIAILAQNPSLRGIADLADRMRALSGNDPEIQRARKALAAMIETAARETASGAPNSVSWTRFILGPDMGLELASSRRILLLQGRLDGEESAVGGDGTGLIRAAAQDLGFQDRGISLRLTGRGPLSKEEMTHAVADIQLAGALSLTLLAFVLIVGFRSWRAIVGCFGALFCGLAWTFGFATLAVGSLTLLSIVFSVLFIGLGIDFAIHYALRYREEAADTSDAPGTAERTAASCGGALGLCAVTSAVGFLSFWPTDYRGLAELGLIAAAGMALALIASLTVLPALFSLMRLPGGAHATMPGGGAVGGWIDRQKRPIVVAAAILSIAALALSTRAEFDFNTLALKDPKAESVQTLIDLQQDGAITPYTLSIPFADRSAAEAAADRLRTLPEVAGVRSLEDLVPAEADLKQAMIEEAAVFLWPALSPPSASGAASEGGAQAALHDLRAQSWDDLPPEDRARLVDGLNALDDADAAAFEDRLTTPLRVTLEGLKDALGARAFTLTDLPQDMVDRYVAPDGGVRIAVLPKEDLRDFAALGDFVDAVTALYPDATGRPVLEAGTGKIVVAAFQQAVAIALGVILAFLIWRLHSFRDAVLVLIPLILAGAATTAFGVLAGIPFNVANVIVLPLVLGLGVDNGVHFVARWREEGDLSAVLKSSTPRAVLLSGGTTLASFATLGIVSNSGISSMGMLLSVAMIAIILSTMIVLPALLAWLGSDRAHIRQI